MAAYDPEPWKDLFVAAAGASAALAGLVFVAVSINVERILQFRGLPERALATVLLLLSVVVVSILGLIPGQSVDALGVELLLGGVVLTVAIAALTRASAGPDPSGEPSHVASAALIVTPATVLLVVGGSSLLAGSGGGLYWVLAAMLGALVGGVLNAWVLLVEILR